MRSIRHAARVLFKTPFVTTVAVLSLALGIGANSAIFSMFDQLLLRSLAVPDADELVNLRSPGPRPGTQSTGQAGNLEFVFSYPMFRDLERQQTSLDGIAAHRSFGANFALRGEPMSGQALYVSGAYFSTLRVQPTLGRLLGPADDETVGAHPVAVISHRLWQSRFGEDSSIVGQSLIVNGRTLTIIGVAPEGFEGTTVGIRPLAYVPLAMSDALENVGTRSTNRRWYWLYAFGRLKPGVSSDLAAAGLNTVFRPIITDVEAPLHSGAGEQTRAEFSARELFLDPGARGQTNIGRNARMPLLMLLSITGVVLLIACANIANLLLARGANRSMEMGVRLALGANRRQLIGQLLTESVLLALMGGAAGILVAQVTLATLQTVLPTDATTAMSFSLEPIVFIYAALLSLGTGVIFGLFPALHSTRADLVGAIRANSGTITRNRAAGRFRSSLVTAQITLSTALLIMAGLFLKSLTNVSRIDLGVNVDNVVTFVLSPERNGYDSTRAHVFFARVEDELRALPGVTGVASSTVPLLSGSNWGTNVSVQGFQVDVDGDAQAQFNEIGTNYFSTVGMTLLAGRDFTTADAAGSARVAIVNETFANKFKLGMGAVGTYMARGRTDSLNIQIVGIVKDAGYSDVKQPVPPVFFVPWRQDPRAGSLSFYVRTSQPPQSLLRVIPPVVARIDPTLPLEQMQTMPAQIRENVFLDRMISGFSASFALLATLLAAVGLYGVLAYTVAQRTREIGVRMALGADAARVRALVMRQVAWMAGIGGTLGVAAALALGRAARAMLFGLEGHDPLVFTLSVVTLVVVALVAGYLPARKAARVSPIRALRYE